VGTAGVGMTEPEPLLQAGLERLYRLDQTPDVQAFRLDEAQAAQLSAAAARRREGLFIVHRGDDEADLGLYIAEPTRRQAFDFLQACARGRPPRGLDGFTAALEGVSHFVYLTHAVASQERAVSAIELEVQAEVDKFIVLRVWLGVGGAQLVSRLFDRFRLHPDVPARDRERYVVANRTARRFARWFDRHWARGRGHEAMARARALYRKPLAAKLEAIDRT